MKIYADWHALLILGLWVAWLGYWLLASLAVKPIARKESSALRWTRTMPLVIAGWLLAAPSVPGWLGGQWMQTPLIPGGWWRYWIGVGLLVVGMAFSVWARLTLGRNWSSVVAVKTDHELIDSGPYHWVRHPIYTGLLMAFLGTGIAEGEVRALVAVALVVVALYFKLRLEEHYMDETFGARYQAYRQNTAALIPGIW